MDNKERERLFAEIKNLEIRVRHKELIVRMHMADKELGVISQGIVDFANAEMKKHMQMMVDTLPKEAAAAVVASELGVSLKLHMPEIVTQMIEKYPAGMMEDGRNLAEEPFNVDEEPVKAEEKPGKVVKMKKNAAGR